MRDPAILIVDDDEMYRRIFVAKFREEKFRVLEARDGEEAWELLEHETPDILLTGILMPRLDGFSLIERIRRDGRHTRMKIFILSHHGRPEDKARADALKVDGFFTMGYVPVEEIALRIRASIEEAPLFVLRIDPDRLDPESQKVLERMGKMLFCERCEKPYTFTFEPDPLRPTGFFSAHVECPECGSA
jgi:DNA-binding response OmpR family regulator